MPENQMHYLAIGIGATELITITLCVSICKKLRLRLDLIMSYLEEPETLGTVHVCE